MTINEVIQDGQKKNLNLKFFYFVCACMCICMWAGVHMEVKGKPVIIPQVQALSLAESFMSLEPVR